MARIQGDRDDFKNALRQAQQSARSAEELDYVSQIEEGYQGYDEELARLPETAEACRAVAARYDWDQAIVPRLEAIYRRCDPTLSSAGGEEAAA